MLDIAVISLHTSPLARPGTRDSGGMNVYIRELSRKLGRRYHRLDLFTRRVDEETPTVVNLDRNARVIQVRTGPIDDSKESLPEHLDEFFSGVLDFQLRAGTSYDLVHSHYWLSGWVGHDLGRCWGAPHVVMFHTLGEAKNRYRPEEREPDHRIEAERRIAIAADRVVCASEWERDLIVHQYGVPEKRVSLVPCGVDTDIFRPIRRREARTRLGLPVDSQIVLFVGRIEPLKGIDIFLRAAACLKARPRLVIVGGDSKDVSRLEELRTLADSLGISERVSFVKAVPHEQMPLFYGAADACVIPSYYESFGLVALEAMACGVPVIASNVGGLRDTVRDGETGFLVPCRAPGPFAERLELVLGSGELADSLGLIARSGVERFSWSSIASEVEQIYNELVSFDRGEALVRHHG